VARASWPQFKTNLAVRSPAARIPLFHVNDGGDHFLVGWGRSELAMHGKSAALVLANDRRAYGDPAGTQVPEQVELRRAERAILVGSRQPGTIEGHRRRVVGSSAMSHTLTMTDGAPA
jgi:hypothetical protein